MIFKGLIPINKNITFISMFKIFLNLHFNFFLIIINLK